MAKDWYTDLQNTIQTYRQTRIQQAAEAQAAMVEYNTTVNTMMLEQLRYQSDLAYKQTLLLEDIRAHLEAMGDQLSRPLTVVGV